MKSNASEALDISPFLDIDQLMSVLQSGHGYSWRVLVKLPKIVAHGESSKNNMPSISIIHRKLFIWDGDENHVRHFSRILEILSQSMIRRGP